ncbi:hypothetical protein QQY66_07645 [Streptomyces sp. DG2A-72]|uniref:hypothetical protein n=1 Tax=Streptomyces sp. DG2A-72 TaxID=3051386 RepID=UPI00265C506C|nr:hypothetical protein [Streptomyces sp. DG2A-72]MDO0931552.1 hypothetical protein [Streptomyces sp. DG2A-72]
MDSLLEWFGFSADDPDLNLFGERLTNLARVHGKTDAVDELRRRFAGGSEGDPEEGPDDVAPPALDEPAL